MYIITPAERLENAVGRHNISVHDVASARKRLARVQAQPARFQPGVEHGVQRVLAVALKRRDGTAAELAAAQAGYERAAAAAAAAAVRAAPASSPAARVRAGIRRPRLPNGTLRLVAAVTAGLWVAGYLPVFHDPDPQIPSTPETTTTTVVPQSPEVLVSEAPSQAVESPQPASDAAAPESPSGGSGPSHAGGGADRPPRGVDHHRAHDLINVDHRHSVLHHRHW